MTKRTAQSRFGAPTFRPQNLVATSTRWLGLVAATIVVLFPVYWIFVYAVGPSGARFEKPSLIPSGIDFSIFVRVFTESEAGVWFANTLIVSMTTMLLTLILSIGAGYAFSRFNTRGIGIIALLTLLIQIMPPIVVMVPLYRFFLDIGLGDTLVGLIVANSLFAFPVITWIIKSTIDNIPVEVEQAAAVDGANRFQILFYITGRLALPGILAGGIVAFLDAWNDYLFARLLIRDSGNWVGSLGIGSFFGVFTTPWDLVMGTALLFAVPPVVLFLLVQKYFMNGLGGAVKG